MKKLCITCLVLSLVINITSAGSLTKPHTNIPLKELADKPTIKSATTHLPVAVELYATYLEVRFNSNLGNQCIVVTNQQGFPVYQQTVNATAGSRVVINTQGWAPGTYTISILDGRGGGYGGQFVK